MQSSSVTSCCSPGPHSRVGSLPSTAHCDSSRRCKFIHSERTIVIQNGTALEPEAKPSDNRHWHRVCSSISVVWLVISFMAPARTDASCILAKAMETQHGALGAMQRAAQPDVHKPPSKPSCSIACRRHGYNHQAGAQLGVHHLGCSHQPSAAQRLVCSASCSSWTSQAHGDISGSSLT